MEIKQTMRTKMTSIHLAIKTWSENSPIDRSWLRNASHKERMNWARAQVQCFADNESKQLIGRAAAIVLRWAEQELY